jgi:hypothetical protein
MKQTIFFIWEARFHVGLLAGVGQAAACSELVGWPNGGKSNGSSGFT